MRGGGQKWNGGGRGIRIRRGRARENANTSASAFQKHCTGAPPAKRDASLLKGMSTCKHTVNVKPSTCIHLRSISENEAYSAIC
jgi:hypothetical protein